MTDRRQQPGASRAAGIELPRANAVIEPFRIKAVEPIPLLSPGERATRIEQAHYNLFRLDADHVTFDLLTDSGTGAMSANQWAGIMAGDESYAGARSFRRFERVVQDLTGKPHVIPTHQGRSAEALLMKALVRPGELVPGNTHFDTTRANIESAGAAALDLPAEVDADPLFPGNLDLDALKQTLEKNATRIPLVILTITNNSAGGLPVSAANVRKTKALLNPHGIPLFIDAARFAENAYFIKHREPGYSDRTVEQIAREIFALADGVLMSAKKDAFGNIGGFLALGDDSLAEAIRTQMVITEGFPTYGGLAGRDLEALAIGLREILEESYLAYRIRSVEYFGEGIEQAGYPVLRPFGGHAVYIDAGKALSHLDAGQFPGQALAVAFYQSIGMRTVEIGSVMFGRRNRETGEEIPAPHELLRLAMPRRVYTQSHVDYMVEMLAHLRPHLNSLPGYRFTYQAEVLRHFTAKFQPIVTPV